MNITWSSEVHKIVAESYSIAIESNQTVSLLDELRTATYDVHQRLHNHPLTEPLTTIGLTTEHYCRILLAFYAYYAPNAIHSQQTQWRLEWLEQDLRYLGKGINDLPQCLNVPPLHSHTERFGYLYVVEGSSLGSQVISKHLRQSLGITPKTGGRFFHAYGKATAAKWCKTKTLLEAQLPIWHGGIVVSAQRAFICLENWLTQYYRGDDNE